MCDANCIITCERVSKLYISVLLRLQNQSKERNYKASLLVPTNKMQDVRHPKLTVQFTKIYLSNNFIFQTCFFRYFLNLKASFYRIAVFNYAVRCRSTRILGYLVCLYMPHILGTETRYVLIQLLWLVQGMTVPAIVSNIREISLLSKTCRVLSSIHQNQLI